MLSRYCLEKLPDDMLIDSTKTLVAKQSELTAELLAHIAEVEVRKLHLKLAYPSLFKFCGQALGLSESMTYKYIGVARAAQRHNAIFNMVAAGELHLSAVIVLVPHLTKDNSGELLQAAAGKSKRQVEQLIAQRFPQPDVPSRVRKLPNKSGQSSSSELRQSRSQVELQTEGAASATDVSATASPDAMTGSSTQKEGTTATATSLTMTTAQVPRQEPSSGPGSVTGTGSSLVDSSGPPAKQGSACQSAPGQTTASTTSPGAARAAAAGTAQRERSRIEALSAARYKVQFTASEQLVDKLRQAQELLRRQVPDGDLAAICERAVDLLLESVVKRRFALGTQKRGKRGSAGSGSRESAAKKQSVSRSSDFGAATISNDPAPPAPSRATGASHRGDGRAPRGPERTRKRTRPSTGVRPEDRSERASGRDHQQECGPSNAARKRRQETEQGHCEWVTVVAGDDLSKRELGSRSRYIPAAVRRQVAERDGLQCTYVGPDGHRCESRDVEFHHLKPFARGGQHSAEEITLRCRAHNAFQAELDYGAEHIARRIQQQAARAKHAG